MATKKTCGVTLEMKGKKADLVCDMKVVPGLESGPHYGPVHADGDEQWGDPMLPPEPMEVPVLK